MQPPNCLRCFTLILSLAASSQAATFTVINTNDAGAGSLRAAIQSANASPGADTIAFNIPGNGVQTIAPLTELPALTNATFVDGYSQPGSQQNSLAVGSDARLLIRLDGSKAVGLASGLKFTGHGHVVRGLVIVKFAEGLQFNGCNNCSIVGNWIGLDVDNLVSGQTFDGIFITAPAFGASSGVVVGGSRPDARNVISGNDNGVFLFGSTVTGVRIEGNYLGTDASGLLPRGNKREGISVQAGAGHFIGTGTPEGRNVISANDGSGIYLLGGTNITVRGNYLGLDATGTRTLGNGSDGIDIHSSDISACTVGGTGAGDGNVIAGNQNGIYILGATTNAILGNFIGTDASGALALGNRASGVAIFSGRGNRIGGPNVGEANLIRFNMAGGVSLVGDATNNPVRANRIFGNRGLGIDLNADGVTPNDPADADTGPEGLQNFPVVTNAMAGAGSIRLQGAFHGAAGAALTLDFYASTQWDFDGLAEGQQWLGSSAVVTDGAGDAAFDVTKLVSVAVGAQITATATDAAGNTSEFSVPVIATAVPTAPAVGLLAVQGTNYIVWPLQPASLVLEETFTLLPTSWHPVIAGMVTLPGGKAFPVPPPAASSNAFYRLKLP